MLEFHTYLMRHGESWLQEIIERIERIEGIRPRFNASLEKRWEALMQDAPMQQKAA